MDDQQTRYSNQRTAAEGEKNSFVFTKKGNKIIQITMWLDSKMCFYKEMN